MICIGNSADRTASSLKCWRISSRAEAPTSGANGTPIYMIPHRGSGASRLAGIGKA